MRSQQLQDETDRKHAERAERRNRARTYTDRAIHPKVLAEELGDHSRFMVKAPTMDQQEK